MRDVVQLPADGAGKRLDAYSYLSTITGTPVVYSQTTVPVSSDGEPVFPSSSTALDDGYATPAVSAVAVLPAGYNGATWDRLRTGATLGSLLTDIADRSGRLLGQVSISGTPTVSVSNEFAGDVTDRSARLLGHVTVDNASLLADVSDRVARLLGHVTVDNFPSSVSVSNFPATQPVSIAATVTADVSDRSARALGAVSISGTPTVTVGNEFAGDVTDRAARLLGHVTVDNASLTTDVSDRSGRLLGQISGINASTVTPGDAAAAGAATYVWGQQAIYNGTNWDRMRAASATGAAAGATGVLAAALHTWGPGSSSYGVVQNASSLADGTSLSAGVPVGNWVYNGATWDRARSAASADATAGTGLPGVGLLGYDPTGAVYRKLLADTNGRLNVVLYNTGGSTIQNAANVADANGGAGILGIANVIFNGSGWDRQRSATGATIGTAAVAEQAATAGGATAFRLLSAATTNLTSLKGSAGQIYNITAYNAAATVRYLKIYNKASAPAPATDTPVHTYPLAASGGQLQIAFPTGLQFATGIAFSITGALADTDTTAIAANDVILNIDYK